MQRADVVLATSTGASPSRPLSHLPRDSFDLVVVDECAQAVEASSWIPLLLALRCVLAGDHWQLPPTILSDKAAADRLLVSLMERAVQLHSDQITRMFTTQYRTNSAIMQWSSEALYDGKLRADGSVARHLLKNLPGVEESEDMSLPLLLIDTAGCGLEELDLESKVSKGNKGKADLVTVHVQRLVASGVPASEIAVIAPYNLQVELLRLRLSGRHPQLEIKSVDGFQGREKEAVVISLGRLVSWRRIDGSTFRSRERAATWPSSATRTQSAITPSCRTLLSTWSRTVKSGVPFSIRTIDVDLSSSVASRPDYLMFRQSKPSVKKDKGARPKQAHPKERYHSIPETKDREASAKKEAALTEQVQRFAKDPTTDCLTLPPTLNSHDRLVVHQVAEKLGLDHSSTGEGSGRHITISKQPIRTGVSELETDSHKGKENDSSSTAVEKLADIRIDAVIDEMRTENLMDVIGDACQEREDVAQDGNRSSEDHTSDALSDKLETEEGKTKQSSAPSKKTQPQESNAATSGETGESYKCQFCQKKLSPRDPLREKDRREATTARAVPDQGEDGQIQAAERLREDSRGGFR